jgi:valyl-tRNA synthetase
VTADIENYRLYLASEKIYHYVWHTFADDIIEKSKAVLNGDDIEARKRMQFALYYILHGCLKLLHPFMPFITEEIYQSLPMKECDFLMVAPWPTGK